MWDWAAADHLPWRRQNASASCALSAFKSLSLAQLKLIWLFGDHEFRSGSAHCAMNSQPTVILDESCASLMDSVAKFASPFVFKRRGGFLMEPRLAAAELSEQLGQRGLTPPYLLVGASYAAFTQLLFSFQRPETVAGMILVDPSHPMQGKKALARLEAEYGGASVAMEKFRLMLSGFGPAWEEGCRQVSAVSTLGNIPLLVLAAGALEMPDELALSLREKLLHERHDLLRDYCRLTSKAELRIMAGLGHDITRLAPQVVIDAIKQMIVPGWVSG
jgi:pimeloyl-ACP methyl ester carboxylesterase